MYLLQVLVQHENLMLNQEYSYLSTELVELYTRVKINFAGQNLIGLVTKVENYDSTNNQSEYQLKMISEVIDQKPLINAELFKLALYMQKTYLVSKMAAINTMLPAGMKAKDQKASAKDMYLIYQESNETISDKQLVAKEYLQNSKQVLLAEFFKLYSSYVANTLVKKGYAKKELKDKIYLLVDEQQSQFKPLSKAQETAFNQIIQSQKQVNLLHGVTGSGKTEIFLHLAKHYLEKGQSVLVLVPEITLTIMMQKRFASLFANEIALLHSKLSASQKYQEYQKIASGQVKLVVGTRSAIFAPLQNLGIIILDEEHDQSYKQQNNVPYHTIEIAKERAKTNNAKVLLASATPSIISYTKAMQKDYEYIYLENRFNDVKMPKINLVDLNYEDIHNLVSHTTIAKMQEFLNNNKQIIVLLNRRGYYNFFQCKDCGEIIKCPDCDLPLTYHKKSNSFICHHCGYTLNDLTVCSSCGSSDFKKVGFGTQKVEEYLLAQFKDYRIGRLDHDSVKNVATLESMIDSFANHEIDILIGTQMIAKGLDFSNADLVVVLNIDNSLSFNHFDASEKAFQLLVQVSGRSGRHSGKGEVIIETYLKDDYVIQKALTNDYHGFYQIEMSKRRQYQNPPFYKQAMLMLVSNQEQKVIKEINNVEYTLRKHFSDNPKIIIEQSYLASNKLAKMYRQAILIKYYDYEQLIKPLYKLKTYYAKKKDVSLIIDPNIY